MPNHFTLTRRDVSCCHSNRVIFTCEDNMLFSHVKISYFRAKAHLVFIGVYIIKDRNTYNVIIQLQLIVTLNERSHSTITYRYI